MPVGVAHGFAVCVVPAGVVAVPPVVIDAVHRQLLAQGDECADVLAQFGVVVLPVNPGGGVVLAVAVVVALLTVAELIACQKHGRTVG